VRALLVDLQIKLMGKGNALPIQQCFRARDPAKYQVSWQFVSIKPGKPMHVLGAEAAVVGDKRKCLLNQSITGHDPQET
jgi:hypothetical protein